MDTLHTGSKIQDLITISVGDDLTFSIRGKASHPNSDVQENTRTSSVKVRVSEGVFSMSIFDPEDKYDNITPVVVSGTNRETNISTETIPLFYEQRDYEVYVEYLKKDPSDVVEFWHESELLREKVFDRVKIKKERERRASLYGTINFRNEIGNSRFEVRVNGKCVICLDIQVYPSKMDYEEDYHQMLEDVTEEIYNLAFDFVKRTTESVETNEKWGNTDTEFFSIIREIFGEMKLAVDEIVHKAHHELQQYHEVVPVHKLRKVDNSTIKWMNNHPNAARRMEDGRVRFEKVQATKKTITFDTKENQFVKFILESTVKRLQTLEERLTKPSSYRKNEKNKSHNREVLDTLDGMIKYLHEKVNYSFLKQVSGWSSTHSMSLVFAMAPGYRELYKHYMKLNMGLSISGDLFQISMKDTAKLYEYWCFIKLNQIVRRKRGADGFPMYRTHSNQILNVDTSGISVQLKKGNPSKVSYINDTNGERIELRYNPVILNDTTTTQIPDNVLSLTKREPEDHDFQYVFDAKYRVNMALDGSSYKQIYKGPGPEEDTINTMHRYRDAIVSASGEGDSKEYARDMFGAYVLFPLADEEGKYADHPFYTSISKVNVGGLPFLPQNTKMVEEFIDKLIRESADSAFERATLPQGVAERLQYVDLSERNVLVGMLQNRKQFDHCLDKKCYFIPADEISDSRFPLEYIALHQTKELFGEDAGIKFYGRIRKYSKKLRNEKLYYYFDIMEWNELPNKITVESGGRRYYTNIELLKCSKTRQELMMTSLEQLRLYTELMRIAKDVKIDANGNSVQGFEYNGTFINAYDEYVHVRDRKGQYTRYLLSYVTGCRAKAFREIWKDITVL